MDDLDSEHEELVSLINDKLKDISDLDKLIIELTGSLKIARAENLELQARVENLEDNNAEDVLNAIETQGHLDISPRWRIGESSGGTGDFIILDKVSTGRTGSQPSFYRFAPGV